MLNLYVGITVLVYMAIPSSGPYSPATIGVSLFRLNLNHFKWEGLVIFSNLIVLAIAIGMTHFFLKSLNIENKLENRSSTVIAMLLSAVATIFPIVLVVIDPKSQFISLAYFVSNIAKVMVIFLVIKTALQFKPSLSAS